MLRNRLVLALYCSASVTITIIRANDGNSLVLLPDKNSCTFFLGTWHLSINRTNLRPLLLLVIIFHISQYSIKSNHNTASFYIASRLQGLVLAAKGDSTEPGVEVVLVQKKHTSDEEHNHQLWKFTPDGFIQNIATGLVLDVHANDEGNKVVLLKDVIYAKLIIYVGNCMEKEAEG